MSAVKAYIYAEDGALLGFIAYTATPPDVLELGERYFQRKGSSMEMEDLDGVGVRAYDYWEIDLEPELDVIHICIGCGRNASLIWWKCCTEHLELESPDVYCQACVERLHPGDPEFQR
jgi:hypothetical protein